MHASISSTVRILMAILFVAGITTGCNNQDEQSDSDVSIPVSVSEASYSPISEYLQTTGTVKAIRSSDLVTRAEGDYYLQTNPRTNQLYALGDEIRKGESLVRLENREYELNIQLESVKLEKKISEQEYDKQKALYEKGGVTLRELTNAEKTYINAQTALEQARLNLDKLSVVAPFTGVITQLPYYTQGTHISANTTTGKLMQYRELILEVNFPEKVLNRVEPGQQVRVSHYSLEENELEGNVTEISPAVDPDTRMFDAKIRVQNQEGLLRPGMFAKAHVMIRHKDSVITLPREVILDRDNRKIVYIVESDRARERRVITGIESGERVEIRDGIKKDERVVTDGYETLRDRSKVKVLR